MRPGHQGGQPVIRWEGRERERVVILCLGMRLRAEQDGLDLNGNKSEEKESLLEQRLREEFRGHERIPVSKKSGTP